MADPMGICSRRKEIVESARTVVVKIGTNALSTADDQLDENRVREIAEQIFHIRQTGRKVVLVSSGAVGAGLGLLGIHRRPKDLPHLQGAAAVGQAHLIHVYDECFRRHGFRAAQLLLTGNDFKQRTRYLNVRNTLLTLFEFPVVPVINENDTVSVNEIRFGDNDRLAALVTNLLQAPLLVILTVVNGLLDGPPDSADSRRIPIVDSLDEKTLSHVSSQRSSRGTGGMQSKLDAVRSVTTAGENVIIANGTQPGILTNIFDGHDVGTLFPAAGQPVPAWKRWLGYAAAPRGRVMLDAGACEAVSLKGRSLLAIGIKRVDGDFSRGELVSLVDESGRELGRGLTNYDAKTLEQIRGKRGEEIAEILHSVPYAEVIHRDNLAIIS